MVGCAVRRERRHDNGPMSHEPADHVTNTLTGKVTGTSIQAGRVEGGIHVYHGARHHVVDHFPTRGTPDSEWLLGQPSRLLDGRSEVVRFTGRDAELRRLREWRDSTSTRLSVLLLHGPGGQGKTRLAAEFAERSRDEDLPPARRWEVVQADFHRETPTLVDSPQREGSAGLLLIVDYADRWAHSELVRLLHDPVLHEQRPVRVLLIGRTVRWYAAVRGELSDLRADADDLSLPDLVGDRFAMFAAARDRYVEPDLFDLGDPEGIQPPCSLDQRDFGSVLTLHMAALVAVDARKRGEMPPDRPHEMSAYLLDREYRAWQRLFDTGDRGHGYTTRPPVMARTVFTSVLTGAVSHDTGTKALRMLDLPAHPQDLLLDHRFCYPPADRELVLEPLYPDRLAEDFIGLLTPGHGITAYDPDPWAGGVPATLLSGSHDLRAIITPRVVTFLASAADRWPHVGEKVLYPLLRAEPALALEAGSGALTLLAGVDGVPIDVLGEIAALLPEGESVGDLDIGAAALTETLTTHHLAITTEPAMLALLHANFASRLANAGRTQEALHHSRRAVDHYADLVAVNRAAHLFNLAWSLANRASYLVAAGQLPEALDCSQRSVECYGELVVADRDGCLSNLAAATGNHGSFLSRAGRRQEALEYSQRAVGYYSELVHRDRAAHLADLAASVDNYACRLVAAGRIPEALSQSRHAVDHFEELVRADRSRHLLGLAHALDNHAMVLAEDRQGLQALPFCQRAVECYSELAKANRSVHLADLATAESNYANRLAEIGRVLEALEHSRRAVEHGHELVEVSRVAYVPFLALVLHNHASHLADERQPEALEHSRRAVELREELVAADRVAHLPDLARSLWSFTSVRFRLGADLDAARHAGVRAVDLYSELAATEPAAFTRELSSAAGVLAAVLDALGLPDKAGEVRREHRLESSEVMIALKQSQVVVERARDLALADPAHLPDFAVTAGNHARHLAAAGQIDAALKYSLFSVDYFGELVKAGNAAFLPSLAASVHNHADFLSIAERPEALEYSQRAVEHFHELVAADRATYLDLLAMATHDHASRLANAGRREALDYSQRTVAAYEELAEQNRVTHLLPLARSLWTFTAVRLVLGVDMESARQAGGRAVDLYRELAELDPAASASLPSVAEALAQVLDALGNAADADQVRRELVPGYPSA